jgi:BlaI family transcriptional regulator, penicillinase repressor
MKLGGNLSKREHQIMDLAYERGSIGSGELEELLPGKPSNSAIRVHLRSLESKGFLDHVEEPGRFTYRPTRPRDAVAKGEVARLLTTFFGGSVTAAVSTLLDQERDKLTPAEIAELRQLIDKAAEEGR